MGKSIKELVKFIDIFGIDFNFTIFKQSKFNTLIGGLTTISCIIFFFVLFYYFAQDLINNKNPSISLNNFNSEHYPFINVNNSIFPVAWRFENENKQPIDLNGYVYIQWELVQTYKNSSTGVFSPIANYYFNNTPCSSVSFNNNYLTEILDGWNCVDFSKIRNLTIGGFYGGDNKIINYLKGRAFYCKWNFTSNTYSNCTDYLKLNSLLNAQTKNYLSIYLPTLNIDPNNQITPLSVDVINFFSTLAPLLMKTDRFFYKSVKVSQDIGWFFSTVQNFTGFDLIRRDQDLQMRTVDDYNNPQLIKTLMTTIVYIDKQVSTYEANFIKVQTVIANVGGVFKIFTMIIAFVLYFIHVKHRLDALISYLFEFDKKKKRLSIQDFQNILKNYKIDSPPRKLNKSTKNRKETDQENNESKINKSQNINNESSISKKVLNENEIKLRFEIVECEVIKNQDNNSPIKKSLPDVKIMNEEVKNKFSIGLDISIFLLIKNYFCRRNISQTQKDSLLLYQITKKIVMKKSDIVYYFKLIDQFEKFKQIFLDNFQSMSLNFMEKQQVHFEYDSTKIEKKERQNIILYYRDKLKKNEISETDFKILECIEKPIIEEIFKTEE